MTFKGIREYILSLKQDLVIEDLLITEYTEALSQKEILESLGDEDSREIFDIIRVLRDDSKIHKEVLENLVVEFQKIGQ